MSIYLDVVWALNFMVDLMLLMLVQILARNATRKVRLFFGAFIASCIVPLTIFYPNSFLDHFVGKMFYSLLIIFSTFGFKNLYRFIKLTLLFYFVSFAIGGGLMAIHFFLQRPITVTLDGVITFNQGYGDPVSWLFVIIGFPIIWLFTKRRMDEHVGEQVKYDQMYKIRLTMNHQSFESIGYIDSGNQLIDPLTKQPVVICDQPFLKQWFEEKEWEELRSIKEHLDLEQLPKRWEDKFHVIPYQGVDGAHSFMLAIRAEELTIYYNNEILQAANVLIGIQFGVLEKDGQYHCLLHPLVIKQSITQSA
ncbi:sigma-E processing peptidase SpoIIGA [Oceanobacillus sp. J11TS1]|uniref:sigma-E processing peptidase SpoIIGA n=1 Tax=Oceanobacillus sp. J11TS1 TaxID=2807191 RepID=UPI001B116C4F|nr:sigma-E processing peptidase SpoIIGA [Oceanobacillus sp. J11TS1]GIO21883.1 sporulation sigma-E factor-processing peptidase [Oceanobacillus sp. J11TS1]